MLYVFTTKRNEYQYQYQMRNNLGIHWVHYFAQGDVAASTWHFVWLLFYAYTVCEDKTSLQIATKMDQLSDASM